MMAGLNLNSLKKSKNGNAKKVSDGFPGLKKTEEEQPNLSL
jgi:hypothetical protein